VQPPEVSYAHSGDVAIAYQVVGEGSPDIVFVRGLTGDLLSTWEQPLLVRHVEGLAACGRVLMLDKRGTGLSDRVREVQSIETTMDDVRAVMESVGSENAVLWTGGTSTGIGVLFAATYPERCAGLVLFDPRVRGTRSPDYPWAPTEEEWRERLARVRAGWGERAYLDDLAREWAPEVAADDDFRDWFVWHMRRSISPGAALTSFRAAMELDVSDVLAAVRVPTLILPRPSLPGPATSRRSGYEALSSSCSPNCAVSTPGSMTRRTARRWRRLRVSFRASRDTAVPSVCSQPSSSRISSARPRWRLEWATRSGENCFSDITPLFDGNLRDIRGGNSIRPVTDSSPRSTGRPAPSRLRLRFAMRCRPSRSRSEQDSTPASAR